MKQKENGVFCHKEVGDLVIPPRKVVFVMKVSTLFKIWPLPGILFTFVLYNQSVEAHPVSFEGAWGLVSSATAKKSDFQAIYSFSPRFALAGYYLQERGSEFLIPRAHFLLKRWNNLESQGNLYLLIGSGQEIYRSSSASARVYELSGDWESRKYYTTLSYSRMDRDLRENPNWSEISIQSYQGRLGFAPYLGDYKDLSTWFILQADLRTDESETSLTPLLRFYYRNVLWEMGSSFRGSWLFNFMIHY